MFFHKNDPHICIFSGICARVALIFSPESSDQGRTDRSQRGVTLQTFSLNWFFSSENQWGIDDIKTLPYGHIFFNVTIPAYPCANFIFVGQKCSMVGDPFDIVFFLPHPIIPLLLSFSPPSLAMHTGTLPRIKTSRGGGISFSSSLDWG